MTLSFSTVLKIFWSYIWRFFLLLFLFLFVLIINVIIIGTNFPNFLVSLFKIFPDDLDKIYSIIDILSLPFNEQGIYWGHLFFIYGITFLSSVFINRFVMNRLPSISYEEGKIQLMKNETAIQKFDYRNAVDISWWLFWRGCVLMLPLNEGLHIYLQNVFVDSILGIIVQLMIMYWMLQSKRTGAWMAFVPNTQASVQK